jgi:hypothetical protein
MRILDSEGVKYHMDPANNYLMRTNGAFARGEAATEIIDKTKIEVIAEEEGVPDDNISGTPILEVLEKEPIGRGNNPNIPAYLKTAMAELSHVPGIKKTDIANAFGVSGATVTHASRGVQQNGTPIPEVQIALKGMQAKREEIEHAALAKTMATLGILTEDDIECLGAKDKADVAMKLSKVAENMRPKGEAMNDNRIQVVINAPQIRDAVHYAEVEV